MKDYDGMIDGLIRTIDDAKYEQRKLKERLIYNRHWIATCKEELKKLIQEKEASRCSE